MSAPSLFGIRLFSALKHLDRKGLSRAQLAPSCPELEKERH